MEWIKVNHCDELPKDESTFLSLFGGVICLARYQKETDRFLIISEPVRGYPYEEEDLEEEFPWKSCVWLINPQSEHQISYYIIIPEKPNY